LGLKFYITSRCPTIQGALFSVFQVVKEGFQFLFSQAQGCFFERKTHYFRTTTTAGSEEEETTVYSIISFQERIQHSWTRRTTVHLHDRRSTSSTTKWKSEVHGFSYSSKVLQTRLLGVSINGW
jgi:hypothetical protein